MARRCQAPFTANLEQEPEVTIGKTLRPQQLPPAVHDYLSQRRRMTYHFHAESGQARA